MMLSPSFSFIIIICDLPFITTLNMYILPLRTHPELHSIDEPPTLVTLVSTCFWVAAVGTGAFYKTVSQETLTVLTTQLLHCLLN